MPRLTNLDDVLFPVAVYPVFVSLPHRDGVRPLRVPDKKAIVNGSNSRVLGVVSSTYRLVTNREALDLGFQCCRTVFPETRPSEWEVNATDAPSTGGHCAIDLKHNSTALDFSFVPATERPDVFGPFIRVTNSYNGLRALRFDIGFYRKVCKNGMILPESIIQFKFNHLRRDLRETITFDVASNRLTKAKESFGECLRTLTGCSIGRGDLVPLMMAVLQIKSIRPPEPDRQDVLEWMALETHLHEITDRYADDLGENAYALFNTITEFASHPPVNMHLHRDRHSLQRLAGQWLSNFSQQCRHPDFDLHEYLGTINIEPQQRAVQL